MKHEFSSSDLAAYLDEALPAAEMARIEEAVRSDAQLLSELAEIVQRRDQGLHSLGDVWRRHRLSCPPRQQLGAFLLDVLEPEAANYVMFHISEVGCRYCAANLDDLRREQHKLDPERPKRHRKYFDSSAGYLRRI